MLFERLSKDVQHIVDRILFDDRYRVVMKQYHDEWLDEHGNGNGNYWSDTLDCFRDCSHFVVANYRWLQRHTAGPWTICQFNGAKARGKPKRTPKRYIH